MSAKDSNSERDALRELEQFGTIRRISNHQSPSTKSKTIVHIQDIHRNNEAQANIAAAIQALDKSGSLSTLALEGAFDNVDLTPFARFSDKPALRAVADYMLKENRITGAMYGVLSKNLRTNELRTENFSVVGIDDEIHYHANVDAYRRAVPLVKTEKEKLARWKKELADKKLKAYSSQLMAFDSKVQAYRDGAISMGEYAEAISRRDDKTQANLRIFLEALALERTLDFSRVEAERARLLSDLVRKLTPLANQQLVDASLAYRAGRLSHTDFYALLKKLCEKHGIVLARYPVMNAYLNYVLLTDQIDGEKLNAELRTTENSTYATLAKTNEEKSLIAESRQAHLVGKLLDFALTKDEWTEYQKLSPGNLSSFETFYKEAEIRDAKMAENLLAYGLQLKANGPIILVTGGFHSRGIDQRLTDAGYNVVTFVPKITKVDTENGSAYLSVFTQEKSSLDKLFAGEKLFLSQLQKENLPQTLFAAAGIAGNPQEALTHALPNAPFQLKKKTVRGGRIETVWKNTKTGVLRTMEVVWSGRAVEKITEKIPGWLHGITLTGFTEWRDLFRPQSIDEHPIKALAKKFKLTPTRVRQQLQNNKRFLQAATAVAFGATIAMAWHQFKDSPAILILCLVIAAPLTLFLTSPLLHDGGNLYRLATHGVMSTKLIFENARMTGIMFRDGYLSHREYWDRYYNGVIAEIKAAAEQIPPEHRNRVVVLGSNEGRDLPLEWLATEFKEVVLVDLDEVGMQAAVARLPSGLQSKVRIENADISTLNGSRGAGYLATEAIRILENHGPLNLNEATAEIHKKFAELAPAAFPTDLPWRDDLRADFVISSNVSSQVGVQMWDTILRFAYGRFRKRLSKEIINKPEPLQKALFHYHSALLNGLLRNDEGRIYWTDTYDAIRPVHEVVADGKGADTMDRFYLAAGPLFEEWNLYRIFGNNKVARERFVEECNKRFARKVRQSPDFNFNALNSMFEEGNYNVMAVFASMVPDLIDEKLVPAAWVLDVIDPYMYLYHKTVGAKPMVPQPIESWLVGENLSVVSTGERTMLYDAAPAMNFEDQSAYYSKSYVLKRKSELTQETNGLASKPQLDTATSETIGETLQNQLLRQENLLRIILETALPTVLELAHQQSQWNPIDLSTFIVASINDGRDFESAYAELADNHPLESPADEARQQSFYLIWTFCQSAAANPLAQDFITIVNLHSDFSSLVSLAEIKGEAHTSFEDVLASATLEERAAIKNSTKPNERQTKRRARRTNVPAPQAETTSAKEISPTEVLAQALTFEGILYRKGNEITPGFWRPYHQRIQKEIMEAGQQIPENQRKRVVALGANEARELPLEWLAANFDEVVLLDLDVLGMEMARARLPENLRGKVRLEQRDITAVNGRGVADFTDDILSIIQRSDRWEKASTEIQAYMDGFQLTHSNLWPDDFRSNFVISTNLTTQIMSHVKHILMDAAREKFGENAVNALNQMPGINLLWKNVFYQHGETLAALLREGESRAYWIDTYLKPLNHARIDELPNPAETRANFENAAVQLLLNWNLKEIFDRSFAAARIFEEAYRAAVREETGNPSAITPDINLLIEMFAERNAGVAITFLRTLPTLVEIKAIPMPWMEALAAPYLLAYAQTVGVIAMTPRPIEDWLCGDSLSVISMNNGPWVMGPFNFLEPGEEGAYLAQSYTLKHKGGATANSAASSLLYLKELVDLKPGETPPMTLKIKGLLYAIIVEGGVISTLARTLDLWVHPVATFFIFLIPIAIYAARHVHYQNILHARKTGLSPPFEQQLSMFATHVLFLSAYVWMPHLAAALAPLPQHATWLFPFIIHAAWDALNIFRPNTRRTRTLVVFPPSGSQFEKELEELHQIPEARAIIDRINKIVNDYYMPAFSVMSKNGEGIDDITALQIKCVTHQIALWEVFKKTIGEPAAITGVSRGSVAAAYAAGAMSLEDAVHATIENSRYLQKMAKRHPNLRFAVVRGVGRDQLKGMIQECNRKIEHKTPAVISIFGSENYHVVAAEVNQLLDEKAGLGEAVARAGGKIYRVKLAITSHNPTFVDGDDDYLTFTDKLAKRLRAPEIPLFSENGKPLGYASDIVEDSRDTIFQPIHWDDATRSIFSKLPDARHVVMLGAKPVVYESQKENGVLPANISVDFAQTGADVDRLAEEFNTPALTFKRGPVGLRIVLFTAAAVAAYIACSVLYNLYAQDYLQANPLYRVVYGFPLDGLRGTIGLYLAHIWKNKLSGQTRPFNEDKVKGWGALMVPNVLVHAFFVYSWLFPSFLTFSFIADPLLRAANQSLVMQGILTPLVFAPLSYILWKMWIDRENFETAVARAKKHILKIVDMAFLFYFPGHMAGIYLNQYSPILALAFLGVFGLAWQITNVVILDGDTHHPEPSVPNRWSLRWMLHNYYDMPLFSRLLLLFVYGSFFLPGALIIHMLTASPSAAAAVVGTMIAAWLAHTLLRRPLAFPNLMVSMNLLDVGAEVDVNNKRITQKNALRKAAALIPTLNSLGAGWVYVYGGLFRMGDITRQVHQVPTAGQHFLRSADGSVVVEVQKYATRNVVMDNGVAVRDSHGSGFGAVSMRELNDDLSEGSVERDLENLITVAHQHQMKFVTDFVFWKDPSAVNSSNYKKVIYREMHEGDRTEWARIAGDPAAESVFADKLADRNQGFAVVTVSDEGGRRPVLVLHQSISDPHKDQAIPNIFLTDVQDDFIADLNALIDRGVDGVRVDLIYKLFAGTVRAQLLAMGSPSADNYREGEEPLRRILLEAKAHAHAKGRTFTIIGEAYNKPNPDRDYLLNQWADCVDQVYYKEIFDDYKENKQDSLHASMQWAIKNKGRLIAFPANFDEDSLANIGGLIDLFMARLIRLCQSGVTVMVDLRELMGHHGQLIPVPGPAHPVVTNGEMKQRMTQPLAKILRESQIFRLIQKISPIDNGHPTEHLDSNSQHTTTAMGVLTRGGRSAVMIIDGNPEWVSVPAHFLEHVGLNDPSAQNDIELVNASHRVINHLTGLEVPLEIFTDLNDAAHPFRMKIPPIGIAGAMLAIEPIKGARLKKLLTKWPPTNMRVAQTSALNFVNLYLARLVVVAASVGCFYTYDALTAMLCTIAIAFLYCLSESGHEFAHQLWNKYYGLPTELKYTRGEGNLFERLFNGGIGIDDSAGWPGVVASFSAYLGFVLAAAFLPGPPLVYIAAAGINAIFAFSPGDWRWLTGIQNTHLIIDGLVHQLDRIPMDGKSHKPRPDEKEPLKAADLTGDRRVLHEKAEKNLRLVFQMMEREFGETVANEVRGTITVLGLFSETKLLSNHFYRPVYRLGRARNSRGSWVVYMPLRVLGSSDIPDAATIDELNDNPEALEELRMNAYALASSYDWEREYKRVVELGYSDEEIYVAMERYAAQLRRVERTKGFVTWRILRNYWVDCWNDLKTLRRLRRELQVEFQKFQEDSANLQRLITGILVDDRYVDPETGVVDRHKVRNAFQDHRVEIGRFQERVKDLTYRAISFGDYHMALPMVRMAIYFWVVDSGIAPVSQYVTMVRILVRTRQFAPAREALKNLLTGNIPLEIIADGKPRTVWLQPFPGETEQFKTFQGPVLLKWLGRSLRRQAQIVRSNRTRAEVVKERAQLERLVKRILNPALEETDSGSILLSANDAPKTKKTTPLFGNPLLSAAEEVLFALPFIGTVMLVPMRIVFIVLHLLSPPVSRNGLVNLFRILTVPTLISVLPFVFFDNPDFVHFVVIHLVLNITAVAVNWIVSALGGPEDFFGLGSIWIPANSPTLSPPEQLRFLLGTRNFDAGTAHQEWQDMQALITTVEDSVAKLNTEVLSQTGENPELTARDVLLPYCDASTFMGTSYLKPIYFRKRRLSSAVSRINRDIINQLFTHIAAPGPRLALTRIFDAHFRTLGWDDYLRKYLGPGSWQLVGIEDNTRMFSIVFKFTFRNVDDASVPDMEIFIKKGDRTLINDTAYIEIQNFMLDDMPRRVPMYFENDKEPDAGLLIATPYPGVPMGSALPKVEEGDWVLFYQYIEQLARHAALGDIFGRNDRKLSNSNVELKGNSVSSITDFDTLFFLDGARNHVWGLEDIRWGVSEINQLHLLTVGNQEFDDQALRYFIAYYKQTWMDVVKHKETLLRLLARRYGTPEEVIAKQEALHDRLETSLTKQVQRMLQAYLIRYPIRRVYRDYLVQVRDLIGTAQLQGLDAFLPDNRLTHRLQALPMVLSEKIVARYPDTLRERPTITAVVADIERLVKTTFGATKAEKMAFDARAAFNKGVEDIQRILKFKKGTIVSLPIKNKFVNALYENILAPLAEEFATTFVTVTTTLWLAADTLPVVRVVFVALHILGPPRSNNKALNIFLKLTSSVLISILPFWIDVSTFCAFFPYIPGFDWLAQTVGSDNAEWTAHAIVLHLIVNAVMTILNFLHHDEPVNQITDILDGAPLNMGVEGLPQHPDMVFRYEGPERAAKALKFADSLAQSVTFLVKDDAEEAAARDAIAGQPFKGSIYFGRERDGLFSGDTINCSELTPSLPSAIRPNASNVMLVFFDGMRPVSVNGGSSDWRQIRMLILSDTLFGGTPLTLEEHLILGEIAADLVTKRHV